MIVKRGDEAEQQPVKFDTFTDGENIGIRRLQLRIHLNPARNFQTGIGCQPRFGADANGHDNQISLKNGFVFQQHYATNLATQAWIVCV